MNFGSTQSCKLTDKSDVGGREAAFVWGDFFVLGDQAYRGETSAASRGSRLIFKAANKEINSNVIKDLIESARIWTQRNAVFSLSLSHRRGNEIHSNWSFLIIIVDL